MSRQWTFMVYMAGDNGRVFPDGRQLMADLQAYGWNDLQKMPAVGSTEQLAIVAQYDSLDRRDATPRFYIDGQTQYGTLVDQIPPVNTGDPRCLTDFIVWGMTHYPADHYALILWNHGSGWKDEDIYARYRTAEPAIRSAELTRGLRRGALRSTLFISTAGQIMSMQDSRDRAICYDDSSMDFLDTGELAMALRSAQQQTGRRLAVLGMDACLMSMVEVAYEVHECADVLVSSQEVAPATGWPYTEILRTLADNPLLSPHDLGALITQEYAAYYRRIMRGWEGARNPSATHQSRNDLRFGTSESLQEDLQHAGGRAGAHGLSIYCPRQGCSSYYDRIAFAQTGWPDVLWQVNRVGG
jgi:hypothetical protein